MRSDAQPGGSNSRLYRIWRKMKERCYYVAGHNYKYYGARGINVCRAWKSSFTSFYQWAQVNGYDESLSIDRIKNHLGYSPANCRWSTKLTQSKNRSSSVRVLLDGVELNATDAAKKSSCHKASICYHVKRAKEKGVRQFVCRGQSYSLV